MTVPLLEGTVSGKAAGGSTGQNPFHRIFVRGIGGLVENRKDLTHFPPDSLVQSGSRQPLRDGIQEGHAALLVGHNYAVPNGRKCDSEPLLSLFPFAHFAQNK